MQNPSLPGPLKSRKIVYAAPGLNYLGTQFLNNYFVFENPTRRFETRTVDISEIADFDMNYDWSFDNSNVPINGILHMPEGCGPFPVAVFAHGNHDAAENSTPGYLYLCELLASHGILAATIDVNFLNGHNRGENDGRAIVQLEHVKQFKIWNEQAGHPLFGKVDLSKVMLVGHSRGGEAVGHASLFNRVESIQFDTGAPSVPVDGSAGLGPYQFSIQAVVAIAPTDQQYVPVGGLTAVRDNYFVLHGSRDGDVYTFSGHLAYDRSHRVELTNPTQPAEGFKALLWVHGANHNFFNSEWGQESAGTITRGAQEQIANIYIGAVAQAQLLDRKEYLEVLMDYDKVFDSGWLSRPITLVSQYQSADRLFIQHLEERGPGLQVSPPVTGSVSFVGVTAQKQVFSAPGNGPQSSQGITLDFNHHLLQDAQGMRIDWTDLGGRYTLELDHSSLGIDAFSHIAFRVGHSFEPNNTPGTGQDFTIIFHDDVASTSLAVSSLKSLPYPDRFPQFRPQQPTVFGPYPLRTEPVTVLQTIFIPVQTLRNQGLNPEQLQQLEFLFDRTPSGTIYLDDIQLTNL